MPRFFFNLSCRTTYDQELVVGVDADSPELAEIGINNFLEDEKTNPAQELLVHETTVVSRDFKTCSLIRNSEPENDNADDNPEIA